MLVAHLIGGLDVQGFSPREIKVDGEVLPASLGELIQVCGNISLGAVNLEQDIDYIKSDYIREMEALGILVNDDAEGVVEDNFLMEYVSFSTIVIDAETKEYDLLITL